MITDEQKQLIRELSEQGQTSAEIAEQLQIGKRTVERYKKSPAPTPQEAEESTGDTPSTPDYTTEPPAPSSSKQDELKGRHFCFVVYPSENWIMEHVPDCLYDGREGWGEAPDDWLVQLQNTGLPFVVSPLHDKDEASDSTVQDPHYKKPHWHVIVSWSNTTTYRNARVIAQTILHCPLPQLLRAVEGMYRYLTHADDPDKYQYSEKPRCYNGWERPLDNAAIDELKKEIRKLIYLNNCQEYGELVSECVRLGNEYFQVVSSNTFFFEKLCSSFRHAPILTLGRVFGEFEGEEQEKIADLIEYYGGNKADESDNQ